MAKRPVKKTEIALVKEDLASLADRLDALAAKVAYMETFRPAIEVVRGPEEPPRVWWRWFCGE